MDSFVKLFHEIDKNGNEKITVEELTEYVKENGLDQTMITKWETLFDSQNTGIITLETFCHVLGIKLADARNEFERKEFEETVQTWDFNIIAEDMNDSYKEEVILKLREVTHNTLDIEKQAGDLKAYLDKRFGSSWNVIITPENFWMVLSAVQGASLHIDMNEMRYLMWKTSGL